jgi:MscS family membrane protein
MEQAEDFLHGDLNLIQAEVLRGRGFVVVGTLTTVQSLGYNVSTILQGLGIGGLAFALAAQDTIANLFGSIVVAIDQPFKIG